MATLSDYLPTILRMLTIVIVSGLGVYLIGRLGRSTTADGAGVRRLTPAPMHWVAVIGATALTLAMALVLVRHGGTGKLTGSNVLFLKGLIFVFGVTTIICTFGVMSIYHSDISFDDESISWKANGERRRRRFIDITEIRQNFAGYLVIRFAGGEKLRVDPYARNSYMLGIAIRTATEEAINGSLAEEENAER